MWSRRAVTPARFPSRGERAGEDLVDDGVPDPVGHGAGRLARPVAPIPGLSPDGVGEGRHGDGNGGEHEGVLHGVSEEKELSPHIGSG